MFLSRLAGVSLARPVSLAVPSRARLVDRVRDDRALARRPSPRLAVRASPRRDGSPVRVRGAHLRGLGRDARPERRHRGGHGEHRKRACVRAGSADSDYRRRDSMRGGRSRGGHDESRTVDDDFRSFSTSKKRAAARKDARVRRSIARSIAIAIDARARSNFERRAAMGAAMGARADGCGCARG